MKGILFNLAEEVVSQAHGEDTWDDVLEHAGLEGSYTSLGSYPDQHLTRILAAAGQLLGVDQQTMLRNVAERAIPLLAERYPQFFAAHDDARAFVLTLNDIIHPEVRKLYPGADVPTFRYELVSADALVLGYESARRLCSLAQGFLSGAAAHYGQTITIEQRACMLRGDARCLLYCEFHRVGS
jgi:hypothetical protein